MGHDRSFGLKIAKITANLVQLTFKARHHVIFLLVNLSLCRDKFRLKLIHLMLDQSLFRFQLVLSGYLLLKRIA